MGCDDLTALRIWVDEEWRGEDGIRKIDPFPCYKGNGWEGVVNACMRDTGQTYRPATIYPSKGERIDQAKYVRMNVRFGLDG